MAIQVEVPYQKTVELAGSQEAVYSQLADLKNSVPKFFPGVERLEPEGPDLYHWTFQKIGYGQYELQVRLLTRVSYQKPESIRLTPVREQGLSSLEGGWTIRPAGAADRSLVDINLRLSLELPVPAFLKGMAAPIAQKELTKLFDRYAANVAKTHFT